MGSTGCEVHSLTGAPGFDSSKAEQPSLQGMIRVRSPVEARRDGAEAGSRTLGLFRTKEMLFQTELRRRGSATIVRVRGPYDNYCVGLPNLGSNQDSADPKSAVLPVTPSGKKQGEQSSSTAPKAGAVPRPHGSGHLLTWWQGSDSNRRPLDYEPSELTYCSTLQRSL